MDHDEALDLMETAAVEPEGLDRLMAGDTPEGGRLAGHVSACPACADQLVRLRRASTTIRAAVRELPDPELRGRTLAFVRAVGRDRSGPPSSADPATASGAPAIDAAGPVAAVDHAPAMPAPGPGRARRSGLAARAGWLAAAAAIAVLVGGGVLATTELQRRDEAIDALSAVSAWSIRVNAAPDARSVQLASADGPARGTLMFSPASADLVVVATDLPQPDAGREYRCWMERDGEKRRLGRMYFGGDVAYWVGQAAAVGDAADGTRFGVSLAATDSDEAGTEVMTGVLR